LRAPCGLRPAPSAQTTSSAHGLGGWSRLRGPAVSPAQTGLRSPVVCVTLTFAPDSAQLGYPCLRSPRTPLTSGARAHQPSRGYHAHPQSRPTTARLQALASEFWPVLGGWIVRTVQNSDRKAWAVGWWCQLGRGCSGRNGTKFTPDPQKSRFESVFAIWRRFCPVLFVGPWGSVVDRWARVPGRPGGNASISGISWSWGSAGDLTHHLAASLSRMLAIVFRFFAQPHVLRAVWSATS